MVLEDGWIASQLGLARVAGSLYAASRVNPTCGVKPGNDAGWICMPRFAANLAYLFTERPLIERFAAAAAAGFRAVELQVPYDHAPSAIKAELDRHGLAVLGINTAPGQSAAGEFGVAVAQVHRLPRVDPERNDGQGRYRVELWWDNYRVRRRGLGSFESRVGSRWQAYRERRSDDHMGRESAPRGVCVQTVQHAARLRELGSRIE